jgi:DNA-binding transcriptional ArsR family regulator
MDLTIKKINYPEEANALLYNYVNGESYNNMKAKGRKKIAYDQDIYDKRFQKLIDINDYVLKHLRIDKNILEYYFKELGNPKMSLSIYLLPFTTDVQYNTLEEYQAVAKSKSSKDIIKGFDYLLTQYYSLGKTGDEKPVETLEDLTRVIDQNNLSSEDKWKLIQAYIDYDKHIDELSSIIQKVISLMIECRDDVEELEKEFIGYWSNYIQDDQLIKSLQDKLKFTWESNVLGTCIIPTIFNPQTIALNIKDEEDQKMDIIRIGIMFDINLSVKFSKVDSEDLINTLKLLSDKSKLEILRFIKDKPAYGFEIANELSLSTSTISYHMNALISASLVKLEKDANKIYYSSNKETITDLIEDIQEMLL